MLSKYELKSIFKDEINYFIKHKKSLGYDYKNETNIFKHLDMDLYQLKLKSKKITKETYKKITERNGMSEANYARHYNLITEFCKYLISSGYKNIYYENKTFHIVNNYIPIIFNDTEIKKLFKTMDDYTLSSSSKFYQLNYTYSVLFRLIYACGLRASEVLKLNIENINFNINTIQIVDSKNHISRMVVFSSSMKECLITYINKFNITGILFPNKKNKNICYHSLMYYYKKIIKLAKLNDDATIHCLRHIFVNQAFNQMLEKGYDEDVILIYLHRYLGHKSIHETEYYLHFTDYNKKKIIDNNDTFSKYLYEGVDLNNE